MNKTKQTPFLIYLFGAVFFIAMVVSVSALFYFQEKRSNEDVYKKSQEDYVVHLDQQITTIFNNVVSDVRILSKYKELDRFLADGNNESLNDLSQEFLDFSIFKGVYDQVRFLDNAGQEVVRVNYNNGNPSIVDTKDLQNKSKRYYFVDSFSLDKDEVFISPFDLNMEGGKIEMPLKPMIRVAIPVFYEGEKRGVILLNYLGKQITDPMQVSEKDGILVNFLNQDGYWLFSTSGENDWAFMYDEMLSKNLPEVNNDIWQQIDLHEERQFFNNGDLYTSTTINPYTLAQSSSSGSNKAFSPSLVKLNPLKNKWELYSVVPGSVLYANSSKLLLLLAVIDSVFVAVVIFLLLVVYKHSKEKYASDLKIRSLNDALQIINKILRHDLANSFTAVKNSLEVYSDDKSKEALDNANGAVANGIRLINKMRHLEFALSNEKGKEDFVIEDVVKKASKNIQVKVTVTGSAHVIADQALEVVFANLISNSVRHGGAKKINIDIKNIEPKNLVEIVIADDGSGIPDDIKDKVFDEGFKSGKSGNSGLGLYIVKKTIERYGGFVSIENNTPHGVKFIIKLPKV